MQRGHKEAVAGGSRCTDRWSLNSKNTSFLRLRTRRLCEGTVPYTLQRIGGDSVGVSPLLTSLIKTFYPLTTQQNETQAGKKLQLFKSLIFFHS